MLALTVTPGAPNSLDLENVGPPPVSDGAVVVRMLTLGVCGTDLEIIKGKYGWSPPGTDQLIIGHESLGVVEQAPPGCGLATGDLVVGIVRRPDPVPCPACAADEWDMCRNGRFTERGIKERHGYGSERFPIDPHFAVRIDPALGDLGVLLEPTTVVAKAWEHVEQISLRGWFNPKVALITGAGPIGLLAALLACQRGLETYVVDLVTDGAKPRLVEALGAHYHAGPVAELEAEPDVVIECTGVGQVAIDAILRAAPAAIISLTGLSHSERVVETRADAMNKALVLGNK